MNQTEAMQNSLSLVSHCRDAMVGSIEEGGFPNIKAMFKMENEGLQVFWFGTNTSSKRVAQFRKNPKACIYFVNPENISGLMLVGEMEVREDQPSKERLWREGFEKYYPQGVTDPDYCVLRFVARSGNYYQGLQNVDFELNA